MPIDGLGELASRRSWRGRIRVLGASPVFQMQAALLDAAGAASRG
jgi:hypothetical protein